MSAALVERASDSDDEMDVEANLCCPDALSTVLSCVCLPAWLCSMSVFDQNERAAVLVWGKYVGSINEPGIHIVNPCGVATRKINIARKTLDIREVGVTDKDGNPIYISGNVAYKIISAKKATVDTASPDRYTDEMAPMALRTVAAKCHYNDLRGESTSAMLAVELQKLVTSAGVQILRFQLTDLKYDNQIASAMLARQQAVAQVDAKRTLVHGAAETASSTVMRLKQLGHTFTSENEQRLIHDLLLKNLDPDFKSRCRVLGSLRVQRILRAVDQGQSFDNVLKAMLTLFEISTTEGSLLRLEELNRLSALRRSAATVRVYMIFSNMFIINLSVGVIVDKFMDLKQSGKDDILLTPARGLDISGPSPRIRNFTKGFGSHATVPPEGAQWEEK
ncbi:Band 7 protein [Symbiodinium microadriaticum]|uniref:Band 7 protein n=1 Tax=Symbiodinium microadriaticum TaxID=2951 RepID=A0A1Q9EWB0_SYMMI|nr:Band 7 protein [Symbiodinium microadriaticum]